MKIMNDDIQGQGLPKATGSTYRIPDGYFDRLPDRVMNRINHEGAYPSVKSGPRLKKLYSWISAAAAVIILGWLGLSGPLRESSQERRMEERLNWFVEFSKGDLNEGVLVEYWVDNDLELEGQLSTDEVDLLDYYPDWIIDLN